MHYNLEKGVKHIVVQQAGLLCCYLGQEEGCENEVIGSGTMEDIVEQGILVYVKTMSTRISGSVCDL